VSELLPLSFRGVDEGSDPKSQPPGTLLVAENCAMDKARRIVKRRGTTGLAKAVLASVLGATPIAAGKRILSRGGADLGIVDGETAFSYSASLLKWGALDRPPSIRATKRPLIDSTRSVSLCDVAVWHDVLVTLFLARNAAPFLQVTSLSTGQQLFAVAPRSIGDATYVSPRVFVDGDGIAHMFCATGGGEVRGWRLDLSDMTLTGPTVLVNDAKAQSPIDVVLGNGVIYLAYEKAAGANRTTITEFDMSHIPVGATISYLGTGVLQYCLAAASRVYLAFTTPNVTNIVTATTALAAVVGPTAVEAGVSSNSIFIAEHDSANALVGWCRADTGGARFTSSLYSATTHNAVAASNRLTHGIIVTIKPWSVAGRWYTEAVTMSFDDAGLSTAPIPAASSVVVEIETMASASGFQASEHPHVATLENQTGWFATGSVSASLQKAEIDDDGNVYVPAAFRHIEPGNITVQISVGWNLYRLASDLCDTFRCASIGKSSLCAAGAPFWFDGLTSMPYGFACAPLILSAGSSVGGLMAVGSYSYVAVYTWRDANGVLHRSIPSDPVVGTTAGANLTLNVKVTTACLSGKQRRTFGTDNANPVLIEIFRTTVGATGPHYRLTQEPTYSMLFNDPQAASVTLVDAKPDSDITSGTALIALANQPQLYTDAGELADVPPPAFVTVVTHRGRIAGLASDLRTVWFTKDSTVDVTIAPGFNEVLTLAFAHDKSAFASLDEKLVVYGEDTIDVVFGDGPDDTGGQNTWQIQAVQTDVGCINPRSVVVAPPGSVFQSRRGLELLGRDLTVTWVGKVVEDTLAAFPTITSAVLVASAHEIRFTCIAANGLTGIVLAWDYHHAIWFTRKYKDSSDSLAASVPFVDAALIGGVYTMLTAGGQVYQETAAHKLDGGVDFVARDVQLAPISPTDKMAWHRVKDVSMLGTSVTDHDLEVSIARDYAVAYEQTNVFLATSDATAIGPLEKCRVTLKNQKCRAVKLRIRDLAPTAPGALGTGDGPILEGLALRVGLKSGPAKTTAAEQG